MSNETKLGSPEETQMSALSRLLAMETGAYVLIFFGILGTLTILTILGQEHLVLIVGVGSLLAFLVIMLLSISDRVYTLFCEKQRGTPLGLAILGIFIVLTWYFVPADSFKLTLLSFVVSAIFLLWTLAQAYFMSMPISQTSAKIASNFEDAPKHVAYSYLVLAASLMLPAVFYPYLAWKVLPLLVTAPNRSLTFLWVAGMIVLVGILWVLILRFLRPIMDKQDAIIFGGIFFGVYMLFIFYRSLFFLAKLHDILGGIPRTSLTGNILDVLFMLLTILLAVYSFSKRAFRTNLPFFTENNSVFIAFAFGAGYASAQLYYVAGADNAQVMITRISLISHLLIFLCALIVLLFIPYSYVIAKGYVVPTPFRAAFSLRKPVIADMASMVEEVSEEEVEAEDVMEELGEVEVSEEPPTEETPVDNELADVESVEEVGEETSVEELSAEEEVSEAENDEETFVEEE